MVKELTLETPHLRFSYLSTLSYILTLSCGQSCLKTSGWLVVSIHRAYLVINAEARGELAQGVLVLLHGQEPPLDGPPSHLLQHAPQGPRFLLVPPERQVAPIGQHIQMLILQ